MKRRVVVLAEETGARAAIANILHGAGYVVELASRAGRADELVRRGKVFAAIVGPMAYERSNLQFLQKLATAVPKIIVLASRSADQKVIKRAVPDADIAPYPADDHRLLALLERDASYRLADLESPESLAHFAGWTLDFSERVLLREQGQRVSLTRAEFAVLVALLRSPNRVVSRQHLRRSIDGRSIEPDDRSVDMLIGRLRRKIEREPAAPLLIVTVPSAGYKLAIPEVQVEWSTARPQAMPEHSGAAESPGRRQITVMVGQITGLATLSSELDPEDLQTVIDSIRQDCSRVLLRNEGMLVSLVGDSIIIYFGFPEAREDDARRAVRAGLELIERVRLARTGTETTLSVRIGVATGLVVISRDVGSGISGAIGEAPTIARNLAAFASPGTLVISERTRRLIAGFFDCEQVAPLGEDGSKLVAVWRVIGPTETNDRFAAMASMLVPLAGRKEEFALLRRRWSLARSGHGQVVLITADAGMGKSRLILELRQALQLDAEFVLRFFGSAYDVGTPLSAAKAELRQAARLLPSDPAHVRVQYLRRLLGYGAEPGEETFAHLCDLLSLPVPGRSEIAQFSPQRRKEAAVAALLARVEALATRSPALILVEDAQWVDPTSLEFVTRLVDRAGKWPIMVLITARPEFRPPWQGHSHATTMVLSNLSRAASTSLVSSIAEQDTLSPDIVDAIVARCDGVPLFVEELSKAVLETVGHDEDNASGILDLILDKRIPETLQASLLARLDRLGAAKEIAQVASVIGREFPYDMLKRLVSPSSLPLDVALKKLVSSGLVFVRGMAPLATYIFKHALVRDAAYETLLRDRRKELHAAAAGFLEEEEIEARASAELLAYHHERGGNTDMAAKYYVMAAEHALERAGLTEALTHLNQARRLLSTVEPSEQRLQLELKLYITLGRALIARYGYSAPETREAYSQARIRCVSVRNTSSSPAINFGLWLGAWNAAEYETALAEAQELRAGGERDDHPGVTGLAYMALGMTLALTGNLLAARQHLARALEIDHFALPDQPPHFFPAANGRIASIAYLHDCLLLIGQTESADDLARQAEALVEEAQTSGPRQSYSQALAQNHLLRMYVLRGDAKNAAALSSKLLQISGEQEYPYFHGTSLIYTGWTLAQEGNAVDAITLWHRGVERLHISGAKCWLPRYLALLAEYHAQIGNIEQGLDAIAKAHDVIDKTGERIWEAEVYRVQGRLLQVYGAASRAKHCFETALKIAGSQEAPLFELRAAACLAELAPPIGRPS